MLRPNSSQKMQHQGSKLYVKSKLIQPNKNKVRPQSSRVGGYSRTGISRLTTNHASKPQITYSIIATFNNVSNRDSQIKYLAEHKNSHIADIATIV